MTKSRWLLSVALPGILFGCTVSPDAPPSQRRDMNMSMDGDVVSFDLMQVDLLRPPGAIGSACTQVGDCRFGKQPVCWQRNVLDEPGNALTPGGYCSSQCTADADCAGQGLCVTVSVGQPKHCVAACNNAITCRSPEYACFVLSSSSGYCWPAARLSCNPTTNNGECPGAMPAAACIRRAFEDLGECREKCAIGRNTCRILPNGDKQHCVYLNTTVDTQGRPTRDMFKGSACFRLYPDAKQENQTCAFFDECQDGFQCNLSKDGDRKCHQLCIVGVMTDACSDPMQKCRDVFNAGPGNPGLCLN